MGMLAESGFFNGRFPAIMRPSKILAYGNIKIESSHLTLK
jgi:hypothetical protein